MDIKTIHTLVLGSGASGLAAAVRLKAEGVDDVAILTEGLNKGTSINTGSDKQTYYKLGVCGATPDSPVKMAESYMSAGGMDGDLALIESVTSVRAFFNLVDLGTPFPHDTLGQYAGYKTDHDPAKRATSCGPYTSREMCLALIKEVKRRQIAIYENYVAVKLICDPACRDFSDDAVRNNKVVGVVAVSPEGEFVVFRTKNVVFAVGGPGGLYKTSVYPEVHLGSIGLALEIGALTKNLSESQFGLASFTNTETRVCRAVRRDKVLRPKEFRWNVSGTYMQVVPKFISTAPDGISNRCEFLREYFDDLGDMFGRIFLKGYQWPFDVRKAIDGSSFIDLCVFYETAILGRRVFLDYRENPRNFDFKLLPQEAFDYLEKSDALLDSPFERLQKMNPGAVNLYRDWGIDLAKEPLEIAVCAQHNNGGLAVDRWWRSYNVEGLYPIGEVAGTHGVARPGGSALNSGQVGAFRVAERIAYESRREPFLTEQERREETGRFERIAERTVASLRSAVASMRRNNVDWKTERDELRRRMSESAGMFREEKRVAEAREQARVQLSRVNVVDVDSIDPVKRLEENDVENLRNIQLCVSQATYLDAIYDTIMSGVGSRGSALTLSSDGVSISDKFPTEWKMRPEDPNYRSKILCTQYLANENTAGDVTTRSYWRDARPIPSLDDWFENVWRDYREEKIFE